MTKTTSSGEASSDQGQRVAEGGRGAQVGVGADIAQSLGRQGAGLLRGGDDHLLRAREKDAADFVDGFVAHGAVDQAHPAAGVEAVDVGRQGAGAGGVVGAIEDDLGPLGNALQTAGPAGARDAGLNGGIRNAEARQGHGGGDGVLHLMLAGQRAGQVKIALAGEPEAAAAGVQIEIANGPIGGAGYGDGKLGGALVQHARGFGTLAREDGGHAGLQDSGLFPGDGFQALSQEGFVVEIHGRDDAKIGRDHVGGVQASAEADFQHHHVRRALRRKPATPWR